MGKAVRFSWAPFNARRHLHTRRQRLPGQPREERPRLPAAETAHAVDEPPARCLSACAPFAGTSETLSGSA
eukprot:3619677-Pyramimonas_sp.AAC.1